MLFAGFKVEEGELTLLGITAAGVLGNIVGSWAGYAIGYYGREELLERHHIFHVSPKQMARVEGWFERYGARDRLLHPDAADRPHLHLDPGRRRAHAPSAKFTLYTAAGCIPWVLMLGFIGVKVGENWEEWRDKLHYFDYVVLAGLIGAGRLRLRQVAPRRRRGERRARARRAEARPPRPSRDGLTARRPARPAPRADSARAGDRAGRRPGPGRAAAGLQLRPPDADPLARATGTGRATTPSCARASRSRCTPAPPRPCWSASAA